MDHLFMVEKVSHQLAHQANDRTFLAWINTAISLIGFGFAIARFGFFLRQLQEVLSPEQISQEQLLTSQLLGIGLVVAGLVVIILAVVNYNRIYVQIEQSVYTPSRFLIWVVGGMTLLLGSLSLPLLTMATNGL